MTVIDRLQKILGASKDRHNPGPEEIRDLLESVKRIAVVGISRNPEKAARRVPAYLAAHGYEILPVNPFVDRILGKAAVDSLAQLPEPVDMILVFRPSEEAADIATEAMSRKEQPIIWLQEGIMADAVAAQARQRGISVVQDLCAYKVHVAMKGS